MKSGRIKVILYVFIASFILMLVPIQRDGIVSALITYNYTFEDGTIGSQYTGTHLKTIDEYGNSGVVANYVAGTKAYWVDNISISTWELIYPKATALFYFELEHMPGQINWSIGDSVVFTWWNSTYGNYGVDYMVQMSWTYNDGFEYYDEVAGGVDFTDPLIFIFDSYFGFEVEYPYEDGVLLYHLFDDTYNGDVMEGLAANVNSFEHQQRIDRFTISCDGVENNIFDNLRYKVDEFAGYTSGCDVTGMTLKGGLSLENTITGKGGGQYYNYVKSQYNVPISATINIVKMFLHPYMVENMDVAAVNFYLRINGDLVGTGSSLTDMGSYYVLSFCDLNTSVSNSTVLFVVEQSTKLDSTYGYFYLFASSSNDLDGDGDKQCTVAKTPDGYKSTGEYQYNADLSLMFYINSQYINPEPSPYDTDILTLSDYDVEQYNPVYISYFISTFEFPNTIKIYDDGVQVFNNDAGFPYPIPSGDWDGTRTFVPQSDGTFWIILVRDGSEIVNLTLIVTATTSNYALWSYPNPTNYNNHITIGYVYDNPGNNPGLILLGSNANMNSTGDALRWWTIEDATSGNFTLQQTDNWYIYIYYGDGLGNYYRIYDLDIHQTLTTLEQDKLNVLYNIYTLSSTNSYKFTQQISGHHNWYGMTVEIRINNAFVADVGSTVDFILEKEINTDGDFLVQMYLVSNGTDVLLKEITFSVSFVGTPPSPPTQSFRDLLGGFAWVFGFGLIFMFMLLPMTIASKLGIELPMMANIGSAALGLSFTVYAGLLDQWVIFITVIAMVVGAIVVMFR